MKEDLNKKLNTDIKKTPAPDEAEQIRKQKILEMRPYKKAEPDKVIIYTEEGGQIPMTDYPKTEKGKYIVPDDFFDRYYNQLPDGTINESQNKTAFGAGYTMRLGKDAKSREIQSKGGTVTSTKAQQRKSLAEDLRALLNKKADRHLLEAYDLENKEISNQELLTFALITQASKGNVKAYEVIRDSIGEKMADNINLSATFTDADRALLEKVDQRLKEDN